MLIFGASAAAGVAAAPLLAACGKSSNTTTRAGGTKSLSGQTVTIATVGNPQMTNMQKLVGDFTSSTGIKTMFLTLNEIDLFYRTDLFKTAGPDKPKWQQIQSFAEKLNSASVNGIVLRGEPGWGANMAPFGTVLNTFDGRWYNQNWQPQLTSPQVKNAAAF